MQRLKGKVAVVTGASRGVGRGIALVLGEEGATVYMTGRSSREGQTTVGRDWEGKPVYHSETVEETADLVTARGGVGIPIRVDHTVDEQVEALFERIKQEQGRVDILINNVWGGYENNENYMAPLWEQPLWRWDAMFNAGARAHFTSSRFAIPLMLPQRRGLIVNTTYAYDMNPLPAHIVDLSKNAVNGLVFGLAHQLREHNVAVVGVAPIGRRDAGVWSGEMLQRIYNSLRTGENLDAIFRDHPRLAQGESPEYTGRAVASLAADQNVMEKSGHIFAVDDLALEYGFTDIDGKRPPRATG
ncbi:SDR family NAD(P)-dependent oxidoreductase [Candidatus Poribacteria bacterium]|nr:SDR family NAD(P)-dependent oxidoreductase [Candidatus Poribacteria bacterium]